MSESVKTYFRSRDLIGDVTIEVQSDEENFSVWIGSRQFGQPFTGAGVNSALVDLDRMIRDLTEARELVEAIGRTLIRQGRP